MTVETAVGGGPTRLAVTWGDNTSGQGADGCGVTGLGSGVSPPCRASRRLATFLSLWTFSWRWLAFLGDGGVGFGDGLGFGGDGAGVGFGDGGGVSFGDGGGVEELAGSEDSVDRDATSSSLSVLSSWRLVAWLSSW